MEFNKTIGWAIKIIFIIFAIILIIQILLKLTGHSPVDAQIFYVCMGVIFSYLLTSSYKMGIFVGEVKEFMKMTKNSFSNLREDICLINSKFK